jgi:putative membrane protein
VFFLLTFLVGFVAEIVGVNTGLIFGEYSYSKILGVQVFNVPVIIGLNWFMLVFTVGCMCHQYKVNIFVKSLAGAALLVILDFFLEFVAIKYNFWIWKEGKAPLQNYLAWFLLSFILLLFFNKSVFYKNNRFAKPFYFIQLIFFILLTIL